MVITPVAVSQTVWATTSAYHVGGDAPPVATSWIISPAAMVGEVAPS